MNHSETHSFEPSSLNPCPAAERAHILVLDDDKLVAWTLGEMIRLLGHETTVCLSPFQALDLIEQCHFDLIVCDWRMPEMNGREFHRAVATRFPGLERQIVFLTGASDDKTLKFLKSNSAPHLFKPFQLVDLQKMLTACLANDLDRLIAKAA